jgi:hypothetical protein
MAKIRAAHEGDAAHKDDGRARGRWLRMRMMTVQEGDSVF